MSNFFFVALDHAGLFRLSGAQEKIETLKGLVDKGWGQK